MRARFREAWVVFAGALCAALLSPAAFAIVAPEMPQAMEEAPVDRAIANIAADETLVPAQRERLLGRLHLIAYAQGKVALTRYANGEWQPRGQPVCGDSGYIRPGEHERLCPYGYEGLEVARELPGDTRVLAALRRNYLQQARAHYQRALALDESNLRARLGYAYVLDELGEDNTARENLRRIIALSDSHFHESHRGVEYTDWESHAVLSEAVEHLGALARARGDRAAVARLRARLRNSRPSGYVTPIVVPLRDAPFDTLTAPNAPVVFDFAGTGDARAHGWLTPEAAWLVWDPEWRGQVRSGFDMIGQRTWAVFWNDGFEALRALDDDRDGELTGAELGGLALWRDANSNGVSEPGEVLPVQVHGIVGLAVRGERTRRDLITAPRGVRYDDGATHPLYDWTPGLVSRRPVS